MIWHKYKILFLHYGKCGGTSMRLAIKWGVLKKHGYKPDDPGFHRSFSDMENEIVSMNLNIDDYFKFAVLRNPWDRLVSWYYHCIKHKKPYKDFEDFFYNEPRLKYKDWDKLDFHIKLEEMQEGYKQLLNYIDLPKVNMPHFDHHGTRKTSDYRPFFNSKMIEIVYEENKDVINHFGYNFN